MYFCLSAPQRRSERHTNHEIALMQARAQYLFVNSFMLPQTQAQCPLLVTHALVDCAGQLSLQTCSLGSLYMPCRVFQPLTCVSTAFCWHPGGLVRLL